MTGIIGKTSAAMIKSEPDAPLVEMDVDEDVSLLQIKSK